MVAVPSVWSASSAAPTVTATPDCQLPLVSATCAGLTVMPVSPALRARATLTVVPLAGAADRRTVSGAVPPSPTVSDAGLRLTAGVEGLPPPPQVVPFSVNDVGLEKLPV